MGLDELTRKADGGELMAELLLAFEASAAPREEALFVARRVAAHPIDMLNPSGGEARARIAGQIEEMMARPLRRAEEALVRRILRQERRGEFWPDLVAVEADARTDDRDQPRQARAFVEHLRDRCFEHAADGAAPAGMGCSDDPG